MFCLDYSKYLVFLLLFHTRIHVKVFCLFCAPLKLENHTYVKKVGDTLEFLFTIYWWTWKTKRKIKKNTCRYHYQNLDDVIYSSWDIEKNILKLVILGHLCPFTPKKPQKSKFWKIKKFAGDIIILHICTKNPNHMMYGFSETEWDTSRIFCHFGPFFTLSASWQPGKSKF